MSKKKAKRLEAFVEDLIEGVTELSPAEVDDLLAASGSDLSVVRKMLHGTASEIAASYRRSGHAAPKALIRFAEEMDDRVTLPHDPKVAEAKAMKMIRSLGDVFRCPGGTVSIAEAYRKGDADLSDRDRELLDKVSESLRKKVEDDGTK